MGEHETNTERIFGTANMSPYVKDGINNYVVNGNDHAVNPENSGTKSSAHYQLNVGAGKTATIRLRRAIFPLPPRETRSRVSMRPSRPVRVRRTSSTNL